jgi:hypothetical protein
MATFSKKMMGKEVGDASVYAEPHTMAGKPLKTGAPSGVNHSRADSVNMTVGNIDRREPTGPKTSGIKVRGTGAATKGLMARGPMA